MDFYFEDYLFGMEFFFGFFLVNSIVLLFGGFIFYICVWFYLIFKYLNSFDFLIFCV